MHVPLRACSQKAHASTRQAAPRQASAWQVCLHHQPGLAAAWANSRAPIQSRRRRERVRVQSQATTGTKVSMPSRPGEQIAWGNYMSRALSLRSAVREAATKVMASLAPGAQPTLAIVFVSSIHGQEFEQVIPLLKEMVPSLQHVFGCSGYGIVGGGPEGPEEAEGEPSFSLTLGSIPGADIQVLHTLRSSIPAPDATPEEWADFVGVPHDSSRPVSFLTFADPRFAQVRDMVAGLDYAFPNSPKIGAILSSGTRSRSRAMFAWSATPHTRKRQWPQRSERRDSSRADFYTSQARAELPQLKPRPSMPSLSAESTADESAQAETGSEAEARGAAADSAEVGAGSSSSSTDEMPSSGEGLQGASRNGTGSEASSSASQASSTQPSTSSRGAPEDLERSPLRSQETRSQAQTDARSGGVGASEAQPSSSSPQSQPQGSTSSSSSSSSGGGAGGSGNGAPAQSGMQALGSFFSRVMAPLSSLGSAFQQQRQQQQQRLGRGSSSTDSERGQGTPASGSSSSRSSSSREGGEVSSASADQRNGTPASSSLPSAGSRGERDVLDFVPTKQDVDGSAVIDLEDILSSGSGSSSSSNSTVTPSAPRANRVASTFQSLFGRRSARAKEGRAGSSGSLEEEANEDGSQGGVYMYGAVVLALHGDVVLDTVTSMGYRAPSPCIWRIEGVTSKNEIVSIVPEALSDAGGSSSMGSDSRGSLLGSSGRGPSARSSLLEDSSDEEYDDSELSELFAGSPEVQAITAVVDMLDGLGDEGIDQWSEILDGAAVAIAPDSSKRAHELGPEDWELLPLVDILEEYGVLKVGNSPVLGGGCDLRPGHRMKLMVRDAQGVREGMSNAMLRYKRNNLGAMMSGTDLPPTFGTLLLTDVDRGIECYGMPHHESRIAHSYVPAPLAGIFGGAQIGPLKGGPGGGNGSTGILENSAVLGVLRAATDKSPAAVKRQADAKADAVRQEKERSEGGASASAGSMEAKGEDGESGEEKRSEEGKK